MALVIKGKTVISGGGGGASPNQTLNSKALAYWMMDSTASSRGNLIAALTELSPKNGPSLVSGLFGNCYEFNNGSSQALQNNSISLHLFKSWSLVFWSYTLPGYQYGYGAAKYNSNSPSLSQFLTLIYPGGTDIEFYVASGSGLYVVSAANALNVNQWQLNIFQFSSRDGRISAWIDGSERASGTIPVGTTLNAVSEPFAIGGYQTSTNVPIQHYKGRIGLCAVFGDTLTSDEIDWLWNGGAGNILS